MKNRIIVISTALLFGACVNLTPAQQTALSAVAFTAFDAGVGYLTGGAPGAVAAASPDLAADISDAAVALRSNQTATGAGTLPSAATITASIQTIATSPAVAKAIGPQISQSIASAVASGVKPNTALEAAAQGLEKAAAPVYAANPAAK